MSIVEAQRMGTWYPVQFLSVKSFQWSPKEHRQAKRSERSDWQGGLRIYKGLKEEGDRFQELKSNVTCVKYRGWGWGGQDATTKVSRGENMNDL